MNKALAELFEKAPPQSLKKSVNHIFFNFLLNNRYTLPKDFDRITEDVYFLIQFLEKAQKEKQR